MRRACGPALAIDGILPIDKPMGCSSFDVVRRLKWAFGFKKIGHAGTLDPLATGLLVILLGKATRCSQALMSGEKTYEGTMRLGIETDTYDCEGSIVQTRPVDGMTLERIRRVFQTFLGDQYQQPPMFSAKKINGVPLYKLARKGQSVEREPRLITIFQLEALRYEAPDVWFRMRCSKGTYVRSFVQDCGEALQCGAHVTALRRTQSGDLSISQAAPLDVLLEAPSLETLRSYLIPYEGWMAQQDDVGCVPEP